jgi:hypothetical protein
VAVVGEDFADAPFPHDVHRDASDEAVLLVGAALIKGEAGEERVVGL